MPAENALLSGGESSFRFDCTLCGQCCSGSMKVFLNPEDLRRLGRFLGMDHTERLFLEGYLVKDRGQNGLLFPRMRFRGHRPGFCPFVENHWNQDTRTLRALCALHGKAKPLVCRLAPLARELDFPDAGAGSDASPAESWFLQEPVTGCPGMDRGEEQLLREALAPLRKELEGEVEFFRRLREEETRGGSPESLFETFFLFPLEPDSPAGGD